MNYHWNLQDLFIDDTAWEEAFAAFRKNAEELENYRGRLGESAKTLLEFLEKSEALSVQLDPISNYANRKSDEDTRVSTYQAMCDRLMAACVEAQEKLSFELPELMALEDDLLARFYQDEPKLEGFRRYLTRQRRKKPHILSPECEALLASAGQMAEAPDTIYSMLCDADLTFEDAMDGNGQSHPLRQGTYISYLMSEDRTLRASAFASMYGAYAKHENSLAATLSAQVKTLQFYAQARRFTSPLEASLEENEVPEAVYHSLIEEVNRRLPSLHRYFSLRKRVMGLEELHMYDLYCPMAAGVGEEIPYEKAQETVKAALAPLGQEYLDILQTGFDGGWIDVYEQPGKRSGAYSAGARVHPYVLLNYTGTLDDQFTLAHEMGHAIHSFLSNRTQRPMDADYVIFVAEVASTCNEALLMEYLLQKEQDKAKRAYLLTHYLEQFRTTLYRQTMFAEFELAIAQNHAAGVALTAEKLKGLYYALVRKYHGESVVCDREIEMEWARIPHFYYDYYVYQYATGFSAAIALADSILNKNGAGSYLRFLSSGCKAEPIELLKLAGVDLSTPAPVAQALNQFDALLDELEALLS